MSDTHNNLTDVGPPLEPAKSPKSHLGLLWDFVCDNKKLLTGLGSGIMGSVLDGAWLNIVEFPEGLMWRGFFAALLLSVFSILLAKCVIDVLGRWSRASRNVAYATLTLISALLTLAGFPYLIKQCDLQWKTGGEIYLFRDILEPLAYGLVFASFAFFVAFSLHWFVELFLLKEQAPSKPIRRIR